VCDAWVGVVLVACVCVCVCVGVWVYVWVCMWVCVWVTDVVAWVDIGGGKGMHPCVSGWWG
jgi:hypothetical protein